VKKKSGDRSQETELRTKKKIVISARAKSTARRKRLEVISLFGTVDFDPSYDYKRERMRKRLGEQDAETAPVSLKPKPAHRRQG